MSRRNRRVLGVIIGIIVGAVLIAQIWLTGEEEAPYRSVEYEFMAVSEGGAYIVESNVYKAEDTANIIYISEDQAFEWGIAYQFMPGATYNVIIDDTGIVRVE